MFARMKTKLFRYLSATLAALALVLALALSASAQSGVYTRPTVTRMLVNHNDGEDRRLAVEFADIPKIKSGTTAPQEKMTTLA